jgi:hypothetical protein
MNRRATKWTVEPGLGLLRRALFVYRNGHMNSVEIQRLIGVPARTLRRYVADSCDPGNAQLYLPETDMERRRREVQKVCDAYGKYSPEAFAAGRRFVQMQPRKRSRIVTYMEDTEDEEDEEDSAVGCKGRDGEKDDDEGHVGQESTDDRDLRDNHPKDLMKDSEGQEPSGAAISTAESAIPALLPDLLPLAAEPTRPEPVRPLEPYFACGADLLLSEILQPAWWQPAPPSWPDDTPLTPPEASEEESAHCVLTHVGAWRAESFADSAARTWAV